MKELVIAGIAGIPLMLVSGATAQAVSSEQMEITTVARTSINSELVGKDTAMTVMEEEIAKSLLEAELQQMVDERRANVQAAYEKQLLENNVAVETVITQLLDRVGRTWYVFGGSSPSGWDCSGLVLWAYAELGVELPHSASQQSELGMAVTTPQIGDAVFFNAGAGVYHAAIYLGDNMVIHSGFKPGRKTEVISLDSPAFSGNVITYQRFIDLGN